VSPGSDARPIDLGKERSQRHWIRSVGRRVLLSGRLRSCCRGGRRRRRSRPEQRTRWSARSWV